ncbi:FadR/GntR family transcriptional regulator [Paraburkholderia sp. BL17N1]|uniref:FadR/GntR family transcriptional regulator n=1 Tax=Paraburkholderia sp. BL17N1 TaxID=1938798 RepID=UPI000EB4A28E|nr:FadR/GntR family transcriptional regulator [Paraburkholderia sp. BL17N1]RKR37744.1 GntR family transcriptional regulator [Paraburkholderia sp. BL17N1]
MKQTEPKRLYQLVADQIRGLIHGGDFPPGSRLPAERELSQQLGVSRPSLREALIALEIGGSVETRMGSGVYVRETANESEGSLAVLGESPTEIMQARAVIEGSLVVLASTRLTAASLDRLRRSVDAMHRLASAGKSPLEPDRQFHLIIAEAAGNTVLSRYVADLFDARRDPIGARISELAENTTTWMAAVEEHERVLHALQAGDPLAAQAAMRSHLKSSEERWVGSDMKKVAPNDADSKAARVRLS